ncbi:hypothetical protein KO353_06310 [Elioraea tepida]|jgi:hypothetical protein|uniref:Uncharacterized protein n=1 Tax=Elioraea tepida TaxID=2843330 RepID=A0A975YKI9_9PROT|nr:DUF6505 family protein [Elioraea tepida]QXM25809.1 hypothetical protein KO353_06310 [Elioraea tepida]
MTRRILRTLRLDPSDTVVFDRAAEPGEIAVVGSFMFWDVDPAALTGRARQAFRSGFLGLGSFGFSTLVSVGSVTEEERAAAAASLAARLRDQFGAPDDASALAVAEEELAFSEELASGHEPGTVIALSRSVEAEGVRERFRTLRRRGSPQALPVIGLVRSDDAAEERAERVDLVALVRRANG